ncbi:MAG: cyclic nucleotide-binding domain-containing protein [Gammaproteobacteria bacterium]|nr:cyclic nucleotide-binding domain-containing protein [Gammaproteobacteria bacterium]
MMSKSETAAILRSLRKIPLFNSLNDAELRAILEAPENGIESYPSKKHIVREAELGDCMYVIVEGSVEVMIRAESGGRDITIATLYAGDFFGEQALLPGGTGRRNASVRAMHDCKVFQIAKKYVLLNIQQEDFDEVDSEDVTVTNFVETPEDKDIKDLLKSMRLFRSLKPQEIETFREWTEVVDVGPGEFVIKEDQPGEHLFIVLDGTVEIFLLDNEGKVVILAQHKRGNYFGEQALMPGSDGKRNAYVRMDQKGRLLKVPKQYFRLLLDRDSKLAETLGKIGKLQKDVNTKLAD